MYRLFTQIDIQAPSKRVWEILTDFNAYSSWNPFVSRFQGTPRPGEKVTVTLTQPESKPFTIKPKVKTWDAGRGFAWRGRMMIPGIFDGEHHFEVHDRGKNQTRFVQWEQFSGLLVPFTTKMLEGSTRRGFIEMNTALKKRAESTGDVS